MWTPCIQETLINGVLQGRKQTDPKGASALSRHRMMDLLLETVGLLTFFTIEDKVRQKSYAEMKASRELESRGAVKNDAKTQALKCWDNGADQT